MKRSAMAKSPITIATIPILIGILILLSGLEGSARENHTEKSEIKPVLTLEGFREVLRKELPEFRKNLIAEERAGAKLTTAKGAFDPCLTGTGQWFNLKKYQVGAVFNMDYTRGFTSSLGLNQVVAPTGTRLGVSLNYTQAVVKGSSILELGRKREVLQAQPGVTVEFAQPLLYNAFGLLDRFGKKDASLQVEIEKLQRIEEDRRLENYYSKLYYQWIAYEQMLEILNESIANARNQEAMAIRMMRARLVDNDDVQKARSSRLQYENLYQQHSLALQKVVKELEPVVSLSEYRPDSAIVDRASEKALGRDYVPVSFEDTRTHRILKKTSEKIELSVKAAKNRLLPSLDIVGSVTQKSSEDDFADSIRNFSDTEYYAGFRASFPLGNRKAKGELRQAELALEELQAAADSARNRYDATLGVLEAAGTYRTGYALLEQRLAALRSQLATEQLKYRQARLNLTYVITTLNNIAQTRIDLLNLRLSILAVALDYDNLVQQ